MIFGRAFAPLMVVSLAASALATPNSVPASEASTGRPLDILPAGFDPVLVRRDVLATAAERFGSASLDEALAAPAHLIVKRFAGMAPPPPAGAGPDWRAPTPSALLIRRSTGWF